MFLYLVELGVKVKLELIKLLRLIRLGVELLELLFYIVKIQLELIKLLPVKLGVELLELLFD